MTSDRTCDQEAAWMCGCLYRPTGAWRCHHSRLGSSQLIEELQDEAICLWIRDERSAAGSVLVSGAGHGPCDLRFRPAREVPAAGQARAAAEGQGLASPAHQDRWRLLRSLCIEREG